MDAQSIATLLQIGVAGAFLVLFLRGDIVTKKAAEEWKALFERERQDRIAAEAGLMKFAPANADLAENIADLSRTVLDRLPSSKEYDERMEGRRGR